MKSRPVRWLSPPTTSAPTPRGPTNAACSRPCRSALRSRSASSRISTGQPCTDGLFGSLALRRWSDRARGGPAALLKTPRVAQWNAMAQIFGHPPLQTLHESLRRSNAEPAQVADIGVPFCPRRPAAWSSAAWWAPGWPQRPAPRVRVRTLSPTKPSASPAPMLRAMPGNFRRSCHRHRRRHHHPPARPTSSAAARKAAARAAPSTPSAPHPNCKSPTCPPPHTPGTST